MVNVVTYGASVRGPRNKKAKQRNQDAWLHATGAFGSVIAVCDGLGSRTQSRHGADAACKAVQQAVRHWPGCASGAQPDHLIHLVEVLWRFALGRESPSRYATTCCFALCEPTGHIVLAGLGDGMAAALNDEQHVLVYGARGENDFGNETLALGTSHRVADWWFDTLAPGHVRHVMLASDGVADDLAQEKLGDFIATLTSSYGGLEPAARWRALMRELRDWPVPHHVDDKTLVVMTMEDP